MNLDDYIPGMGCDCFAKHESECGCEGVDWTPKEVYKLMQEKEELAVLVDGAYGLVELYKPEGEYNKKWRENWMAKAKKLVPGCEEL